MCAMDTHIKCFLVSYHPRVHHQQHDASQPERLDDTAGHYATSLAHVLRPEGEGQSSDTASTLQLLGQP